MTERAPGHTCGPLRTALVRCIRLNAFTVSGVVRCTATQRGTPSSSTPSSGAGVITPRPEKSTRLPIIVSRTRPYLPL